MPESRSFAAQSSLLIISCAGCSPLLCLALQCELLTVEKASMASALEDKDAQIGRMQQDEAALQAQVIQCQQQVAKLQAELLQVLCQASCLYCASAGMPVWVTCSVKNSCAHSACGTDSHLLIASQVTML